MEWTIQDLGVIGEFIGALGVIVTLIYLAYQIRQNTVQLQQNELTARAAAVNASNRSLRETRHSIFESAEMSELFMHGNANPHELGDMEELRYRLAMQNVTETILEIYTQTEVTGFSPETWASQGVTLTRRVLGTNGGEWFWENFSDNYPMPFRQEVDRILVQFKKEQQR